MSKHSLTPIKAIRKKCRECYAGSLKGIRICDSVDCPLFPYRMGRRPTEDEKRSLEESLKETETSIRA